MAKNSNSPGKTYNLTAILYTAFFLVLPFISVPALIDHTLTSRQLYLSAFLAIVVLTHLKTLNKSYQLPLVVLSFAGFLAVNLISFTASVNPVESYAVFSKYAVVFVYFLMSWLFLKQGNLNRDVLIKAIIFFGGIAAAVTLFQILKALGNGSFLEDIYSIKGSFSHKNLLSSALMMSLPFMIMGVALYKGLVQKLSWVLLFLIVAEVFMLRTRGVWLATFGAATVAVLAFYQLQKKSAEGLRFPLKIFGIALGLAALILVLFFTSSSAQSSITDSGNITKRTHFWSNSFEMIKDHPLIGVGTGNWKLHFPKYGISGIDESVDQGITQIQRPHNDFLWVWSEGGLLALIFYLGIFLLAVLRIRKNLLEKPGKQEVVINLAALFGISSYFIFSMGDFPMERVSHNLLFFSLIALVFSKGSKPVFNTGKLPFYVSVILIGFALAVNYYRFNGEKAANDVLQANATRNAQAIIPAVEKAENRFYNMDSYSNPLRYYSSLGYLATQRAELAFRELQEAQEIAPYNMLVLNQFGNTYNMLGEKDKALSYFDSALAISPFFEMAILNKGKILMEQKKFQEAYVALSFIRPANNDPRYVLLMAKALRGMLRDHRPEDGYNKVLSYFRGKNPQKPEDYIKIYREAHRDLKAKLQSAQ